MFWWLPFAINAGKNLITGQPQTKGIIESGVSSLTGNLLPGAEATSAAQNIVPGSLESEGLLQFNSATGNYLNPSQYIGESIGMPTYTGGQGLLSNVADDIGSSLGNLTPENLSGVASLLGEQQDTSQYQQMAGTSGGMKQGSGSNLAVQFPQAKVFKKRRA